MQTLTLPLGFNWHNHFRSGPLLACLAIHTLRHFGGSNAMPNLKDRPVHTPAGVRWYYRLLRETADRLGYPDFRFSMAMEVTPETTPAMIYGLRRLADELGIHVTVKTYPRGKTTNAEHGIIDFKAPSFCDVLTAVRETSIVWQVHAEVADDDIPRFRREQAWAPFLYWHVHRDPLLRIAIEHVSSRKMVAAVREFSGHVGMSVTPQHILHTAPDADTDPHLCCMPYPKTAEDRAAIQQLVLEGLPYLWYGDDNAPHLKESKLVAPPQNPASGVCNCVAGLPLMVDWFERQHALDKLGPFIAYHGCDWYGVPRCQGEIVFEERPWIVPPEVGGVIPWMAGREIRYQLKAT